MLIRMLRVDCLVLRTRVVRIIDLVVVMVYFVLIVSKNVFHVLVIFALLIQVHGVNYAIVAHRIVME